MLTLPRFVLLSLWLLTVAVWAEDARVTPVGEESPVSPLLPTDVTLVDGNRIQNPDQEPQNWLSYGRGYDEQRFSPLDQIHRGNVQGLGLAWFFDTDSQRELEATPLVVDGRLYVTGAWSVVYALDARDGKLLWKYDPEVPHSTLHKGCCGPVNRGVALWQGKVYVGTFDGRLLALDAHDGRLLWSVTTVDQDQDYTITGAPRVVKGKVLIGNGGGEFGVRGYLSAYDAETGALVWRFYTVPGNPQDGFENDAMATAARSWRGQWWLHGGGGTVWDSMAYDAEGDLLFFGTGNGSPWNRDIRSPGGGDNLFLASIVAVRPDTGEYVWHYQETPADSWDYTSTQHIVLADINWQGEVRPVILHAPKNGFFFIIDRRDGKLLSAQPFIDVNWATGYDLTTGRPQESWKADWSQGTSRLRPGTIGAHNWQPMSYDPRRKVMYIPANDLFQTFRDSRLTEPFVRRPGHWNTGSDFNEWVPLADPRFYQALVGELLGGQLIAWSPERQQALWRIQQPYPGNGGVLATAGDLVFQGDMEARFSARDSATGDLLWQVDTQMGIIAPPVSYSVDGEQYVTVLTGRGGPSAMILGFELPRPLPERTRVMTFKLGAKGSLPALPSPALAPTLPDTDISGSDLARGRYLFNNHCSHCHGINGVSSRIVPDLRQLHPLWHERFQEVVLGGMMNGAGMPAFEGVLTPSDVQNIQAYVLDQGRRLEDQTQARWWDPILQFVYRVAAWLTHLVW